MYNVYMAQPMDHNIPAFCLACFGTDNKFTAEHVLLRWQYIIKECERRRIWVVSLGGDGDSRLMKAMRISVGLFSKQIDSNLQEGLVSPLQTSIPSAWSAWFWLHRPTSVAYIQDVVHIAVKLKSRLIKPSVVLPMGVFVAGVHHFQILQTMFGKDVHGLMERDIDHKDKQNFDAVLHIVRAVTLLDKLPDAAAMKEFVLLIQYVIDSYLDKGLSPLISKN